MQKEQPHNDNEPFLAKWLSGELSDHELKSVVSETDFNAFLKIRKGIEVYDALEAPTEPSFNKIQEKMRLEKDTGTIKTLTSTSWFIGLAASIVLCIGLFTFLGDDIVTFETNFGEHRTVELLDGSEVVLNSRSSISYNEESWTSKRTLNLNGEAYFKVKKGSAFTVNTNNGAVKVLGTQFNVNSTNDLFEVICFEGKVSVQSQNKDFVLLPTHSVRRINGYAIEQWATSYANPTWIHGESSFKSVPLKYVISALESEYNIHIDAKNIDNSIMYTGSFTHKDLNTALRTVFRSLQIQYIEKEKGKIYLSTK